MKYTINVDKNNYVLSIANTIHDNIEVDLSAIDLLHLSAYQLIDNNLILDNIKLSELLKQEEQKAIVNEIYNLEEKLNSTDYIMARMLEEIMALNSPLTFIADIIKIFMAYATKYKDTLSNRKIWRKRIEELKK